MLDGLDAAHQPQSEAAGGIAGGASCTPQDAAAPSMAALEQKKPCKPVNPVDVLRGILKF